MTQNFFGLFRSGKNAKKNKKKIRRKKHEYNRRKNELDIDAGRSRIDNGIPRDSWIRAEAGGFDSHFNNFKLGGEVRDEKFNDITTGRYAPYARR